MDGTEEEELVGRMHEDIGTDAQVEDINIPVGKVLAQMVVGATMAVAEFE